MQRLDHFLNQGITTVEIKSGYGLDLETELRMLATAGRLQQAAPQHIEATFLGAHAVPPEFAGRPEAYIREIIRVMLPEIKKQGIAKAVDVFCETIAFSRDQTRQVFETAKNWALTSNCTPNNCPTRMVRPWLRKWGRCPVTTWSICQMRA